MADERTEKLLSLADGVRSFFDVTNVTEGRGWSAAFKAVRANDYMADSFLAELRSLIDFIEVEFDPRFGSEKPAPASKKPAAPPPKRAPEPVKAAPPRPAPKPAGVARKVAPPPPPPPRRGFVDDLRTHVSAPPSFALDEPTGRTFVPPVHDPAPKKRK
jgi:hypothetical protein